MMSWQMMMRMRMRMTTVWPLRCQIWTGLQSMEQARYKHLPCDGASGDLVQQQKRRFLYARRRGFSDATLELMLLGGSVMLALTVSVMLASSGSGMSSNETSPVRLAPLLSI